MRSTGLAVGRGAPTAGAAVIDYGFNTVAASSLSACGTPRTPPAWLSGSSTTSRWGSMPRRRRVALADVLATGVTVGAPPDNYTPPGQDWGLPRWRPDRLAATGYGALRDMLRACLLR